MPEFLDIREVRRRAAKNAPRPEPVPEPTFRDIRQIRGGVQGRPAARPGLGANLLGGALTGLRRDPFTAVAVDFIAETTGISDQRLNEIERRVAGSTASQAAAFFTEFAPSLVLGAGVFSLGRAGLALGLKAAAKATVTAGRTGQFARAAARASDFAGQPSRGALALVPKPGVERAAEVIGGSTALGAFEGSRSLAAGESLGEAAKDAAITAAFASTFELGLIGAGRLLAKGRATPRDRQAILRGFKETKLGQKRPASGELAGGILGLNTQATKLTAKINDILQVERTEAELLKAVGDLKFNATIIQRKARGTLTARQKKALIGTDRSPKSGLIQQLRRADRARKAIRRVIDDPANIHFTADVPWKPNQFKQMLSAMGLKVGRTPESFFGKGSVVMAKVGEALRMADDISIKQANGYESVLSKLGFSTQEALGLSNKQVRSGAFMDVFHEWETKSHAGVAEYLEGLGITGTRAATVQNNLKEYREVLKVMNRELFNDAAGRPPMHLGPSSRFGVVEYVPHLGTQINDKSTLSILTKQLGEPEAARVMVSETRVKAIRRAQKASERPEGKVTGFGRMGPIDYDRIAKGSLRDKFQQGYAVDINPFDAALRFMTTGARRVNMSKVVGSEAELIPLFVDAADVEGFSRRLANDTLQAAVGRTYYDNAMTKFASIVTGIQTGSKLTMAVMANMTQPQNTLYWAGFRNTTRGALSAIKNFRNKEVNQAIAIHHSMVKGIGHAYGDEGIFKNAAQTYAEFVLKYSGFSFVEKMNRVHAAYTAHHVLLDGIAKGVQGKLRGNSLDVTRRRFTSMGLDFDSLVTKVRGLGDDFLRSDEFDKITTQAAFRVATQTQFIPSQLRRPTAWNHPVGRVMSQFKTFALAQGRLLRDNVLAEAAHGNLKPLAYFVSVAPLSGELVGDLRALVKGKNRTTRGLDRYLENVSFAGGLGLFSDTIQAARFGRLSGVLLGPTLGDMVDFTERFIQSGASGVGRQLLRQPIMTATMALGSLGIITTSALNDYVDALDLGSDDSSSLLLDDIRAQAFSQKGRLP